MLAWNETKKAVDIPATFKGIEKGIEKGIKKEIEKEIKKIVCFGGYRQVLAGKLIMHLSRWLCFL